MTKKPSEARFEHVLKTARTSRQLVRVARTRIEEGHMDGRVVALGGGLLVLNLLNDDLVVNGYVALRLSDISSVKSPAPHAEFKEKVLRARGQGESRLSLSELTSWRSVLERAAEGWPLATIHREEKNPDTVVIGAIAGISDKEVLLQLVGPDGRWAGGKTRRIPLKEISRVDFGGLYEEALAIAVGLIKKPRPTKASVRRPGRARSD